MDVKAISSVNTLNFEGKTRKNTNKKHKNNQTMPQQLDVSSQSSKAMRNLALGLMALSATSGAMTSCDDVFAEASASASASASAVVIGGGGCHHHDTITIIKPDTIHETDTVIHTIIKPIHVKDYPFHLGDSLLAQGSNIGIPIDGPRPEGDNSVVYMGSKAHNRYDNKFYESMVDSVGTNRRELAIVSKVVDMYDAENPKTSYMKAVVNDVPGKGIKITRFVANTDKKPEDNEQYLWNYAGYEVRTNGRNGKHNTRSIFDNNNNLIYRGNYERGQEAGTFLYGSIIYDEETGEPFYDDKGNPEFAQYDFDQAVMYSDRAKKGGTYYNPEWTYEE